MFLAAKLKKRSHISALVVFASCPSLGGVWMELVRLSDLGLSGGEKGWGRGVQKRAVSLLFAGSLLPPSAGERSTGREDQVGCIEFLGAGFAIKQLAAQI